ncbi:MAG: S8 family serine peptidase [Steroidobacteraceae bacterium]
MKRSIESRITVAAAAALFAFAMPGLAAQLAPGSPPAVAPVKHSPADVPQTPGVLFVPPSSVAKAPVAGKRLAHTNVQLYVPAGQTATTLPPFPGYGYETPQSLECHYGLIPDGASYPACNPNDPALLTATGGSQTIAIVDAYDNPAAGGDLAWFSLQFGLPLKAGQFQVIWANTSNSSCFGGEVPTDETGGWEVEESLDVQWAHAMAPSAQLYLVEACSNYDSDLQQAVLVATNLVQCGSTEINPSTFVLGTCPAVTGSGEVSMSWGEGEYAAETATTCTSSGVYENLFNDGCMTGANVVYVASTGDSPGVGYPSTSPNVVAAGGTTNRRNFPTNFNWEQETAWVFGGGGTSFYEPKPSYQAALTHNPGPYRGVPDLAFDADPYTGVYVYDTFPIEGFYYYEWVIVGGTSVSAPSLSGILNNAATRNGSFAASTNAELTEIYNNRAVQTDFTDIVAGFCGEYMGLTVTSGWDFCTGVGVPQSYAGK